MLGPRERPLISVVIPARNEGQVLRTTIASAIAGRSYLFSLQVVVVDDASGDHSCEQLQRLYEREPSARVDVIRLASWSGVPFARNAGTAASEAEVLFLTDANVRFPANWDAHIWAYLRPNRVLCSGIADANSSFRAYGGTLQIPSMTFSWLRTPGVYGGYVPLSPCAGTIIYADLFRRVGGYDTAMPVYGAAEPEFSVRVWLAGAEIVSVPELMLQHRFRTASERRPFLEGIRLVQLQNYLRLGLLYLDRPRVIQLFRHYAVREPGLFSQALQKVWCGDVWSRRDLLARTLPLRFDSFVHRFGLRDAYGQLATS